MNAEELKSIVQGKTFQSTDYGTTYKFIPENTLQVDGKMADSINYKIIDDNDMLYLDHSSRFGTELLLVEIISTAPPITFALSKRYSKEFFGTWKEIN